VLAHSPIAWSADNNFSAEPAVVAC